MDSTFNFRFVAYTLFIGALFVWIGYLMLPVHVVLNYSMDMLPRITNNLEFWVRGFQILVFGYFIRIVGLVGLSTLYKDSNVSTVLIPGVIVCTLAMLVSGLAEGYYMHMGGWAQWKMNLIPPEQHKSMLDSLETTNEWASCIKRFGRMFLHLGFVFLGWGIYRGELLEKWLGTLAIVIGISGICLLMVFTENPDSYLPMSHVVTAWFILTAILTYRKSLQIK